MPETRAAMRPAGDAAAPDPRRVCFIIEKLADRSGGAERVLIEAANALAARGYVVEILTHEHRGKPPFYPLAFGVSLTNLRRPKAARGRFRQALDRWRERLHRVETPRPPLDRLSWLSKHGGFWRRLERHLALHRPAAAIAFMPPAVNALALADPGYPVRRIASMHNAPEQDFHNPARWDPNPLDRRRRWELVPRMDLIMALLPEYRDWYPPDLREKVVVMPNAVRPLPAERLAGARRKPWIMAVGRLAEVKRHDLLIEAFARLHPEFPDWRLRIFGQGPLEAALAARIRALGIEGPARLMGHTGAIEQEYLQSSILAHPAAFEGFPLAVTEALAAGLPVVGFEDCSGLNRLVENGVNGVLVPADGDRLERLVTALRGLMGDGPGRAALGRAAPETMQAYAPERIIDLWEEQLPPVRRPEGPDEPPRAADASPDSPR